MAMTGQEGLQKLATSSFDIILLDIMMPGMSGLDVLVSIRREHHLAHLPVLVVSASVDPNVIWVANTKLEISDFNFKFPRARNYEIIGLVLGWLVGKPNYPQKLVLGCIEAKFCK